MGQGTHLTRRGFIGATSAAATVVGCRGFMAGRPNFLIIYPDQLRASALSVHGDPNIATPAMDRLASQGLRFDRAYCADPHCSPARAAFLSGTYPSVNGVITTNLRLPDEFTCFSQPMQMAGYKCGYIGKWHVDGAADHVPKGPSRRGFDDYWAAFNKNGHRYTESVYFLDTRDAQRPDPPSLYEPTYQTDLAIAKMEEWRRDPFVMMISYGPPHPPAQLTTQVGSWDGWIPSEYLDRVDPEAFRIQDNVPDDIVNGSRLFLHGYYAATLSIDDCVGRLLGALDRLGLADDTVVVLHSDHGELAGAHGHFGKERPYDEAVRVPLVMRWPRRILPAVSQTLVSGVDLAPTLLGMAGINPDYGMHGVDLAPHILDGAPPPRDTAYVQGRLEYDLSEQWESVRDDQWSYAVTADGAVETLYDIVDDPLEQVDRSADSAAEEALEAMRDHLAGWRQVIGS